MSEAYQLSTLNKSVAYCKSAAHHQSASVSPSTEHNLQMKKRIDYIDAIKGLVIFGVVWVHTVHPNWLTPALVNSIFFFLSGIFFKRKSFATFLRDKVRTILIPFAFFYLLSYPFRLIVHLWDFRTLDTFNWSCILDVFTCSAKSDYLFVNVPLWFLICLFVIQIIYYFVSYLDRRIICVIILLCLLFKGLFLSTPSLFMINHAFYNLSFFALGNLVGPLLIGKLKDTKFHKCSTAISVILLPMWFIPITTQYAYLNDIILHLKLFAVFFSLVSIVSWFDGNKYFAPLRFYGMNSLIILGVHIMPLIFLGRIAYAILGPYSPTIGFLLSIVVMLVMHVVILFCNKYIPMLVGKKVDVSPRF